MKLPTDYVEEIRWGDPVRHSAQPLAQNGHHPYFGGYMRGRAAGKDRDPYPQGMEVREISCEVTLSPAH